MKCFAFLLKVGDRKKKRDMIRGKKKAECLLFWDTAVGEG